MKLSSGEDYEVQTRSYEGPTNTVAGRRFARGYMQPKVWFIKLIPKDDSHGSKETWPSPFWEFRNFSLRENEILKLVLIVAPIVRHTDCEANDTAWFDRRVEAYRNRQISSLIGSQTIGAGLIDYLTGAYLLAFFELAGGAVHVNSDEIDVRTQSGAFLQTDLELNQVALTAS
jgi:hypothetical protein